MRDPRPAVAGDEKDTASFELRVARETPGSSTSILPMVRRFVRELCMRVIHDPDVTTRVIVASYELLDNAVRHGDRDGSSIRVTVDRVAHEADIVIETCNFVVERHAQSLRTILEAPPADDPMMDYARSIQRVALPLDDVASAPPAIRGLGLARVRAEAEFDVACRFEDGMAHVRAHGRFALPRAIVKVR